MYIGKAEKQHVTDRLLKNHEKLITVFKDFDDDIWIGLGRVTKRSLSEEELSSIESALISFHKPRLNGVGVGRWTGDRITIENFDIEDGSYFHDLAEEFTLS